MELNGAQLHLLVNHLPVIGFIGALIAILVAIFAESKELKRFVLLGTFAVGISALAPYFSGESAEDVIENYPGIDEQLIHEHEELAEQATVVAVITSIIAGFVYWRQRSHPEFLPLGLKILFVISLISAALMAATAHEGGKIRHPEIRPSI